MKKVVYLIIFILLSTPILLFAQVPNWQWDEFHPSNVFSNPEVYLFQDNLAGSAEITVPNDPAYQSTEEIFYYHLWCYGSFENPYCYATHLIFAL